MIELLLLVYLILLLCPGNTAVDLLRGTQICATIKSVLEQEFGELLHLAPIARGRACGFRHDLLIDWWLVCFNLNTAIFDKILIEGTIVLCFF